MSVKNEPDVVKELRKEEFNKLLYQKNDDKNYYFLEKKSLENIDESDKSDDSLIIKSEVAPVLSVLNEFEEVKKTLIQPSEEIIIYADDKGGIIDVNNTTIEFLNIKKEKIINKKFWDVIKTNDKKPYEIQDIFESIIAGERQTGFSNNIEDKNGNNVTIAFSFYPIAKQGKIDLLMILGRNVSEMEKYKENLIENGEKFDSLAKYFDMLSDTAIALGKRDLFSNVNDIIFQLDPKGRITFINSAVKKIAGYNPEELVGRTFKKIVPINVWNDIQKTFFSDNDNLEINSFETVIKTKNNVVIPVEINCKLTMHGVELLGKKKKLSIQGSIRDITARKEVEIALKESEENYRTIFENASDVIVYLDRTGNILNINKSIIETFGRKKEEVVGKNFTELGMFETKNLPLIANMMKDVLSGKNYSLFETEIKHTDGSRIPIEVSVCSVKKKGRKEGLLCIVRNITERRKVEEERRKNAERIRKINEELQMANKDLKIAQEELKVLNQNLEKKVEERTDEVQKLLKHKIEFIGQLGHDLKSPLTPVVALVPILKEEETDAKRKELLDVVERNVNYMRDLVGKTLKFERLNSPNLKLNLEEIKLFDIINRILQNKKYLFDEKELSTENNVDKNIITNVDRIEFGELIDNLLTNAFKYTPKGGKITFNSKLEEDYVIISLKDTGIGLTEEQSSHIFEEFYKVDDSRHDLDSSGLGLSICKRIVEKHGGRIWAESPGLKQGSTFYFTIPLKKEKIVVPES
jgi:PAS domain S-box-containing protein